MRSSGHLPLVASVRSTVFSTSPVLMGAILTGGIGTLPPGSMLGVFGPCLHSQRWKFGHGMNPLALELLTVCGSDSP